MIRPAALFTAGLLALGLSVPSPSGAAEVSSFTLDNGMDVVVLEDHRAPAIVHMVWYRVGSADEPPGKSGIAHFLEHLMFKGTDEVGPGEFSDIVAANGGRDNAFTSHDYTAYFQRVAADRLDLMMRLEADRMANLNIASEFVIPERDVVREERNQRTENDPGALLGEQRTAAQFLHHPYGRPIIGWKHEVEALTEADAVAFYKHHYAPNNAILIVAGDVTPEEVRTLAETHYGPIPANPEITLRDRVDEPPQLAERRLRYSDPRVATPYVIRTYLAPERDPGDQRTAAALEILARILGGSGQTSVFARALEFGDGPAVSSSAFYDGTSLDDTVFGVFIVPKEGVSLPAAEAALDGAIAEFLENGVDPDQLARIQNLIRAQLIYEQDDLRSLANRYGAGLTSGLTLEDIQVWPEILTSITADEVLEAARLVFDRRKSVTAWMERPDEVEAATLEVSQ